jgi:hypothetical protein
MGDGALVEFGSAVDAVACAIAIQKELGDHDPVGPANNRIQLRIGHLGEGEKARQVWRELMEINPKYSFAEHVGRLPFQHQADVDRLAEGIRKAGIPA